ncbi:MAG: extracellular solute-binding protein, partial [Clostridia bacterium]|nr:extracellular solute-binding protein [Clostridia bacterium]
MRKLFSIVCLVAMAMTMVAMLAGCGQSSNFDTLTVYNWADYIYDYEEDFKAYYKAHTGRDVEVTYVTFDTNETMLTKVLKGDSKVDVICPSEYAIQKLIEADFLQPINYFDGQFANSVNVNSAIVSKVQDVFSSLAVNGQQVDVTKYFVPYMYGTLGILYNQDVLDEAGITADKVEDAGWGLLFNKANDGTKLSEALNNRIFMKDSIRDVYVATVCFLKQVGKLNGTPYQDLPIGDLINTVDQGLVDLVRAALIEQKDTLYGYEVDFGKNDLIAGIAYVDLAWSGDALYAIEEAESLGVTLNYTAPKVGGNIWFDGWVIPKNATNVEGAKIFIDFLNQPQVAAANMMEIGYSSAVDPQAILNSQEVMQVLFDSYEV